MTGSEVKTYENKLRRAARRRGLELARVKVLSGEESWLLVDPQTRKIASGLVLMTIRDVAVLLDVEPQEGEL